MTFQGNSRRKKTGGRRRPNRKKRKHELGNEPTEPTVDHQVLRTVVVRGGDTKTRVLATDEANLVDGDETRHVTIEGVDENPANPNYARRDIVTKGAVIATEEGRARVTSRPGQDGVVNAVALDE